METLSFPHLCKGHHRPYTQVAAQPQLLRWRIINKLNPEPSKPKAKQAWAVVLLSLIKENTKLEPYQSNPRSEMCVTQSPAKLDYDFVWSSSSFMQRLYKFLASDTAKMKLTLGAHSQHKGPTPFKEHAFLLPANQRMWCRSCFPLRFWL